MGLGWATGSFSASVELVSLSGFSTNEKIFSLPLIGSLLLSSIGLLHGSSYMLSAVLPSLASKVPPSQLSTTVCHLSQILLQILPTEPPQPIPPPSRPPWSRNVGRGRVGYGSIHSYGKGEVEGERGGGWGPGWERCRFDTLFGPGMLRCC